MAERAAPAARTTPGAWLGQFVLYALFAAAIGVFSQWPRYHPIGPGEALIKVSFVHTGKPIDDCRAQSAEELARLPPNMHAPQVCPRERSPVQLTLAVNGRQLLQREAPPSGLKRDGASVMYAKLTVPAGRRTMSVVGPRPPLAREVAAYEKHVHPRLRVKPGITGLWQVSGRSDLPWEESVRLDLGYVENWSLGLDLSIIARTVVAVLARRGAY